MNKKTHTHICCTKIEHMTVKAGKTTILDDVNLHIHCGELTAIIGKNGAGKTTFLKALLDEIPHQGTITFLRGTETDCRNLEKNSKCTPTKKPRFGYVPQRLTVDNGSPFSVSDLVLSCLSKYPVWLPRRKKDKKLVNQVLEITGTSNLSERRLCDLSGGEIQRVMLSLAVSPMPDILLLDEPVSGVDRTGLRVFYQLVSDIRKKYDISILLISHDLDLVAKHADRVVLIDRGVAAAGTAKDVYKTPIFIETFGHIIVDDEYQLGKTE